MSGKTPGLIPAGLRRAGKAAGGGGGGSVASTDITDATTAGRALLTAASVAAQRADLGLGTLATQNASAVAITGGTITGIGTPSSASDAATKAYVDNAIAGLAWKTPVQLATTTAGTLATSFAAGQGVDGDVLVIGDRILVKDQGSLQENGIYVVNASGAPTRATDADSGAELVNAAVFVQRGTVNHDRAWVQTTDAPLTLGASSIVWTGFASAIGGATQAYVDAGDNALSAQLTNFAAKSQNLADLNSAATARTNLGLLAIASSAIVANLTDAGAWGRTIVQAATQAAGTALIALATPSLDGLLAAADKVKINALVALATSGLAADISDATAVGRAMLKAANQAAQTALIALATPSLDGLLAAADKVKINNILNGPKEQSRATAIGLLGTTALYEFFDDFDKVTSGGSPPAGWTLDFSGGSTVQNNSPSSEIGGTFLSSISAGANNRANIYCTSQNVNPGTKDLYVAFRMAVLSGADGNSQNAMGLTTTSFGRQLVAGVVGFLSSTNFVVGFNGQMLTSAGVGLSLGVAIDAAFHLFEFWIIGTTLRARIDGGAIQTSGTAVSGYTPKSGYCGLCSTGATAAVRSMEGSWMYVASLQ